MSSVMRICLWGLVALILVAVLLFGMSASFGGKISFTGVTYSDARKYEAGGTRLPADTQINAVHIDWIAGEINVRVTEGDQFAFSESANRDLKEQEQLHYLVQNGKLTIRYCRSGRNPLANIPAKTLEVEIPRSAIITELDISNVSSDVKVDGAGSFIREIDIENVSGHVTVENASAKTLEMETVSGKLEAKGAFEDIKAESVSSALSFVLDEMPIKFEVETIGGGVEITLPENRGFTATLDSVSGSIKCSFAEVRNRTARYGDGSARLHVETVSGSVVIEMGGW